MTDRPLGRRAEADIREQPAVLARVLDANGTALEIARALVREAPLVRLLAIGSSRHAAGVGAAALELSGRPASVLPAPGMAVPPSALHAGQLVVVLSQSGETPALLDAARSAQDTGCAVVAITNAPASSLARLATVALDCAAGPEGVVAATKSVTAQVVLLRALAGPVEVADLLALVSAVGGVVDGDPGRYVAGAPPEHVVAGGLGAEWVAAEVALKFAEMCGRLLSAEPLVEHLHGPAAVPTSTLALLDPLDPNTGELTGTVLRIGPDPSYDVMTTRIADPALAAVVALVAGQCAALAWAGRLGVDADAPRGLAKVTRTR